MAKFFDPQGFEVAAADALIGGRLRPGFKEILTDGESLHANILMMDAKPKADETSIDAALRAKIATLAKNVGQTPAQYLAATPLAEIQKMAAITATEVLEALSGQGVASKLADYRSQAFADTKAISAARYAGMPMIEAADSENPTPPIITGRSGNDATTAIRNLRYQ